MAKSRKKQKQVGNQQNLIIIAVVVVALVLAGVFFMSSQEDTPTATVDETTNTLTEVVQAKVSPQDYQSLFVEEGTDHILIDVRTPGEFNDGHIDGSVNMDSQTIANYLDQIPTDKPIVLYCRSGNRSSQVSNLLADNGFTNIYDLGGIIDWTAAGYPLQ